jgi:UDPglucose 6-dehydrogenase
LIIIHTEWDEFKTVDLQKISKNKKLKIYDMRNLYSPKKMKSLGISYYSIGR